jgi:hypothetical protein
MDLPTVSFLAWTVAVFVAGMAAGIGGIAVWAFRAMCSADVQDTLSGGL